MVDIALQHVRWGRAYQERGCLGWAHFILTSSFIALRSPALLPPNIPKQPVAERHSGSQALCNSVTLFLFPSTLRTHLMSSKPAAPAAVADDEDDYHSSEDEDFNPGQQPDLGDDDDASSSSESEDESSKPTRKGSKRKIKDVSNAQEDLVEDNSGDEAIIRGAKAKRKKTKDESDDEGGEGGLIKTRAQRAREGKEKVPLSSTKSATVDVDALWKSLNAPSSPPKPIKPAALPSNPQSTLQTITTSRIDPTPSSPSLQKSDGTPLLHAQLTTRITSIVTSSTDLGVQVATAEAATAVPLPAPIGGLIPAEGVETRTETTATIPVEKDGMITIKRTYEFAGETVTEEKQVPANSFEARAYLSSLQTGVTPSASTSTPAKPLRRPMRKASKFDPGIGGGAAKKATKLNSLEKSRLDWAGFVDKEGIGEELDRKRREGGDSYLERQDFLGRVGHRTGERR
ncbi:swr complex subunit [Orbilia brochopaga]|uniref:SWR1-complex protein 5 n=1 Tax=Orbilia brochopaga TaxID=3140254 RepID=A0AAV9V6F6_9PEZI